MAAHVLKEASVGCCFLENAGDMRPQVSRVICPEPRPGDAERLARVAANDEIHKATPRAAVEGSQIRPNRRRVQLAFVHSRSQDFTGVGFDLDSDDRASIRERQLDASIESPDSGAEGSDIDGT